MARISTEKLYRGEGGGGKYGVGGIIGAVMQEIVIQAYQKNKPHPSGQLRHNPPSRQAGWPAEKRFAPKCGANLGET